MILGVAYYPEHWPHERWETDARLMQEAGISRVRMGEFAWHRLEPRPGQYDFAWLAEAIDLLGRYGIGTILGTPTPTYPAWLHELCPDIHQIKSNGQVKEFGQRQDACKNHPLYLKHARSIVEAMATALGQNPQVVAWQTDNEYGCHDTARCYCPHCTRAFRQWLAQRFDGDIAALNAAWGTSFWSQDYDSFEQICPPRDTADRTGNDGQNPGLVLDFYRFSSDVQVTFNRAQIELIRRYSPGRPITHNLMGSGFTHIDYHKLAADLDIVSWDNYPFGANGTDRAPAPLAHDLMRGTKQQNLWVMEQGSGPGGWGSYAATPQPGQMRLWAYQAVARGADMVSFFRWRSCRWGREQYWHGILYHHGLPQRRYAEAQQIGREFRALSSELDGTRMPAEVGILYDYDSLWALESQPNAAPPFDYRAMAGDWDSALARKGGMADAIGPDAELGGYRLVIAPSVHVCSPALAARLIDYVRGGGTLLLGPRSGVKDVEGAIVDELLPGALRELAGCYVEEYDAFSQVSGLQMRLTGEDGRAIVANAYGLADVLVPEGEAQVLLRYADHYYAGRAAAVERRYGAGRCCYLGTVPDETGLDRLLGHLLGSEPAKQPARPESVECSVRARGAQRYAFYLNHAQAAVSTPVARPGLDLLTGQHVTDTLDLAGFGLAIVKEQ